MHSHYGKHSRFDRSSLPLPRVRLWGIVAALAFLSLLLALSVAGNGHRAWNPERGWEWIRQLYGWLAQLFGGAGWLLTAPRGAPSLGIRLVFLTLLVLFFWALRRAMLHSNAYKPGPVHVLDLVDAVPEGYRPRPPLQDLTSQLRKHLSETNLSPPTAPPAEAPAENFLDLLGDVSLEPQKLGTSLLRLFSRLRPRIAYRVGGVLRVREQKPQFGVTVTVTSYAIRGSRAETLWEADWENAVRMAGYWVMAALVPVTRASRIPPWQDWRGRSLPHLLFAYYQEATELSRERKLDDALDHYYAALYRDPTNAQLRAQLAATQEKLGLHLDALESYHGVLTLLAPDASLDNKRLWFAPWDWRRFTQLRHLWGKRGILLARYRYAVVLGTSEKTVTQWCAEDESIHKRRAQARKEIRQSLAPAFAERYWPAVVEYLDEDALDWEAAARKWIKDVLCDEGRKNRIATVRLLFQLACLQEMRRLAQDYPLAHHFPGAGEGIHITPSGLRINRDVWAPLRLAWAHSEWQGHDECETNRPALTLPSGEWLLIPGERPTQGAIKILWRALTAFLHRPKQDGHDEHEQQAPDEHAEWQALAGVLKNWALTYRACVRWPARTMTWPASRDGLDGYLRRARGHRWHQHNWQDHYNAACAYAVAMQGPGQAANSAGDAQQGLAQRAAQELEKAVHCSESGFVQLKRSWLLIDPDLAKLRRDDVFARFEREAYPRSTPDRHHSEDPLPIEMKVYDWQLVTDSAAAMEHIWHARGAQASTDVHTLADWFRDEQELWECVYRIADDQARNWPDRERMLRTVRRVVGPGQLNRAGLPAPVPEFDDPALHDDATSDPNYAKRLIEKIDERFDTIAKYVEKGSPESLSPITRSSLWLVAAKTSDAHGRGLGQRRRLLAGHAVQTICARYAAIWQTLPDIQPGQNRDFEVALRHLPEPRTSGEAAQAAVHLTALVRWLSAGVAYRNGR